MNKLQLIKGSKEIKTSLPCFNLKVRLSDAISNHRPKKVIILIHVPPFTEACLHEGKISNDDFLPFVA